MANKARVFTVGVGPDGQFWNPKYSRPDFPIERVKLIEYSAITQKDQEIEALQKQANAAIATINQMQDKIRPWMNPNSMIGQEISVAWNLGSRFNSENPDLFNAYLKIKELEG